MVIRSKWPIITCIDRADRCGGGTSPLARKSKVHYLVDVGKLIELEPNPCGGPPNRHLVLADLDQAFFGTRNPKLLADDLNATGFGTVVD